MALFMLTTTTFANILSKAVPTNFWLLQRGQELMADDVSLCTQCCASASREDLDVSLAQLTARSKVAVEIEPLVAEARSETFETWSAAEAAVEITAAGPRSFLLDATTLVTVNELGFESAGTGCRVWDASVALSIMLTQRADELRGKALLELGSGVGLCGISAALAGAGPVTLSEIGESLPSAGSSTRLEGGSATPLAQELLLLPNLAANLLRNGVEANVLSLDWEDCLAEGYQPSRTFEVTVGSDLVYEGFPLPALAAAISAHTAPGGVAYVMSASSRFETAGGMALVERLQACGGTVDLEPWTVHNSFGRTELVLATWRRPR